MLSFFAKLLVVLRRLGASRFYKLKSERCTHLHNTVMEAVQCAKQVASQPEIVAIQGGRVDVLSPTEQRIRDFVMGYLSQKPLVPARLYPNIGITGGQISSESAQIQRRTPTQLRRRTPHKNEYQCPYGKRSCGENAIYCAHCNEDYAEFLRMTDEY